MVEKKTDLSGLAQELEALGVRVEDPNLIVVTCECGEVETIPRPTKFLVNIIGSMQFGCKKCGGLIFGPGLWVPQDKPCKESTEVVDS